VEGGLRDEPEDLVIEVSEARTQVRFPRQADCLFPTRCGGSRALFFRHRPAPRSRRARRRM